MLLPCNLRFKTNKQKSQISTRFFSPLETVLNGKFRQFDQISGNNMCFYARITSTHIVVFSIHSHSLCHSECVGILNTLKEKRRVLLHEKVCMTFKHAWYNVNCRYIPLTSCIVAPIVYTNRI